MSGGKACFTEFGEPVAENYREDYEAKSYIQLKRGEGKNYFTLKEDQSDFTFFFAMWPWLYERVKWLADNNMALEDIYRLTYVDQFDRKYIVFELHFKNTKDEMFFKLRW